MNVHLLRSPELSTETYRNVLHLLQQFPGPVHFLECEQETSDNDNPTRNQTWEEKEEFEKIILPDSHCYSRYEFQDNVEAISFPYTETVRSWDDFFDICNQHRFSNEISENDIVILLTDIANDLNWFGAVDSSMTNYFIHTSNWHHYFGNNVDIRFPIAYEVAIWVQRYYMFSNDRELMQSIHHIPLGCANDFCQDKSQIVLKMRTADLCESCMQKLIDKDIPMLHCRQFFEILDGIRTNMTFRNRSALLHRPSRLEIRGHTKRIFFTDLGNLEFRLNPKEKALYLLYLNHIEGISLTDLQDYKVELTALYSNFCNQGDQQSIDEAIALLVNPLENDINVILSRIKKKLSDAVGESLIPFYIIDGERGGKKGVKLDRELISYS